MPERVVELLEVVEVQQQKRPVRSGALAPVEVRLEGLAELPPVGQPGEGVVVGKVSEAALVAAPLGHVDHVQQDLRVLVVAQCAAAQRDVYRLPAHVLQTPVGGGQRAVPGDGAGEVLPQLGAVAFAELGQRTSGQALLRETGERCQAAVGLEDRALGVQQGETVRCVGEQPLGLLVRAAQLLDPLVFGGRVVDQQDGVLGLATVDVRQRYGADRDDALPAGGGVHVAHPQVGH